MSGVKRPALYAPANQAGAKKGAKGSPFKNQQGKAKTKKQSRRQTVSSANTPVAVFEIGMW